MYRNLGELWESSAKNLFAIMRFSLALTAAMLVWIFVVALLPPALAAASALMMALSPPAAYWRQLFVPSFLTWLIFVALLALVNRRCGIPAVYALAGTLGWWWNAKVRRTPRIPPDQLRLFDAVVPLLRLERYLPLPCAQSLIVVGVNDA